MVNMVFVPKLPTNIEKCYFVGAQEAVHESESSMGHRKKKEVYQHTSRNPLHHVDSSWSVGQQFKLKMSDAGVH